MSHTIITMLFMTLTLSSILYAQKDTLTTKQLLSKFDNYEIKKKDKATALFWTSIIPGGGQLYCNSHSAPAYLVSGIAIDYWIFSKLKKHEDISFPLIIALAHKIIDINTSFDAVDIANKNLRIKLSLCLEENKTLFSLSLLI